jgi:hypothetical protein
MELQNARNEILQFITNPAMQAKRINIKSIIEIEVLD